MTHTPDTNHEPTAPVFALATCRRCKGTGIYSYHPACGNTCFGCNGTGQEMRDTGQRRPLTTDERAKYDEYEAGERAREQRAAERAARRAAREIIAAQGDLA